MYQLRVIYTRDTFFILSSIFFVGTYKDNVMYPSKIGPHLTLLKTLTGMGLSLLGSVLRIY